MARRPGGKNFAPRVRSAVDRVLKKLQENGDADSLIEEQLREDFAGTLSKLSGYAPKEIVADITTTSIEDFVTKTATAQAINDSNPEANIH